MKHIAILLAFLMTLSSPVVAQDFQKGFAAAQAGDFATALKEWTPLAEAGDADAQYNLAIKYDDGKGQIITAYPTGLDLGYANLTGVSSGSITGTPSLTSSYSMVNGYVL